MKYAIVNFLRGVIVVLWIATFTGCGGGEKTENFRYFRNYSRTFNDLNNKHLKAAQRIGVHPVASKEEVKKLKGKLEEVKSCRLFEVDDLTHSLPYLVPEACDLLRTIAQDFRDSLDQKGLPSYNIIVTSVLRTHESVRKLRRRNGNASANSAHVYGTTFDIAYTRFKSNGFRETELDKLKSVLAEVLNGLRKNKCCYVRYEYKQGCFHITAR